MGALCSVLGVSGEREQCWEAPGTPCPVPAWPVLLCGTQHPPGPCRSASSSQKSAVSGSTTPTPPPQTTGTHSSGRFGGPRGAASLEGWAVSPRVTSPQPNLTVSPRRAPLSLFYSSGLGLELPDARMQNQNQMFPQPPAQPPAVLGGSECEMALEPRTWPVGLGWWPSAPIGLCAAQIPWGERSTRVAECPSGE